MDTTELSYSDLKVKAMMLLDTDDKVRTISNGINANYVGFI